MTTIKIKEAKKDQLVRTHNKMYQLADKRHKDILRRYREGLITREAFEHFELKYSTEKMTLAKTARLIQSCLL